MKYLSVILIILGMWLHIAWRHDQHEGVYARAIAILMILSGVFVYLEALKNEIVEALSNKIDDSNSEALKNEIIKALSKESDDTNSNA